MEIEISSIIIGILSLATFFIPILYSQKKQKSLHTKMLAKFLEIAANHQLNITINDTPGGRYAIGLDETQQKLLYIDETGDSGHRVIIDLKDVRSVKQINIQHSVKTHVGSTTVIDRLGIKLAFRNHQLNDNILLFYVGKNGLPLGNELELVRRWENIVAHKLKLDHIEKKELEMDNN